MEFFSIVRTALGEQLSSFAAYIFLRQPSSMDAFSPFFCMEMDAGYGAIIVSNRPNHSAVTKMLLILTLPLANCF